MGRLGVIGGLGPMATALFLKMVVEMTDAARDQDHIEMIVYNCPEIPDRTSYILGESGENPAPGLIALGRRLAEQDVSLIAIPCITASYFAPELREAVPVKILNAVESVRAYVLERNYRRVGLMATTGTIRCGLFQEAFAGSGCALILPGEKRQEDVMHVIYENVKANRPVERHRFEAASEELRAAGAELIILGCTELSVVREQEPIGAGYLDAMQLMAKCAVEECGSLRREYRELVTREV